MKADRKEWIWYGIVSLIYILWVIWLTELLVTPGTPHHFRPVYHQKSELDFLETPRWQEQQGCRMA